MKKGILLLFSIFNDILNNDNGMVQKIQVGDNKILSINYMVSNNHPKLFDIVEYTIILKTNLNELKLSNINIIFNNSERNKVNIINSAF